MTVEAPKRTWTDERLDDKVDDGFAKADKKMDDGFAKIDADIRELRGEMKAGFDKVDASFREVRGEMKGGFDKFDAKMDAGFAKFDAKFDKMTSWLLGAAAVIIAAWIGLIGALLHGPAL